MGKNVSNLDRGIRLGLAVIFFVVAGVSGFGSVLGIIMTVLGAVMVVTAAVGFCPLYRIFGLSTYKAAS